MRLAKYGLLALLVLTIPYVASMIMIVITGDRIEGMKLAVTPGFLLPQIIFGLYFIKQIWILKLLRTFILVSIIYGLSLVVMNFGLIKTNFDLYGFWDLSITSFLTGIIIWESYYQLDKKLNR